MISFLNTKSDFHMKPKTLRDFGFGKTSMEGMIHQEIQDLLSSMEKEVGSIVQVQKKFNISVVNALWTIITGNRYNLKQ